MRVFDNKIREHAASYMNRVPLPLMNLLQCIVVFHEEGAGLVAVRRTHDGNRPITIAHLQPSAQVS